MVKILVCRLAMFENMGATGILMGLIRSLQSYIPDVEITLLGSKAEYEKFEQMLDIKLRRHPWNSGYEGWLGMAGAAMLILFDFCRCSLYRLAARLIKSIETPYERYDVVIDSNVDNLDEPAYGSHFVTVSLLQTFLEWAVFRRPMATTPTDVSPFITQRNRWFARFVLNKLDIVAMREKTSYNYCLQLGLSKTKTCLTGDGAFLLESAPRETVDAIFQQEHIARGREPFIGFSPNWLEMRHFAFSKANSVEERRKRYAELMAAMIDYVIDKLSATVCFIPHVTSADTDDREPCLRIYEQVKNKQAVVLLQGNYMPDEIKGVIGSCDMFIGCRMHSTIAATLMGVPTIAIAYVDKFYRIIGETLGQEEYIADIRNPSFDELLAELKAKIDSLWENRDKVRQVLRERGEIAKRQAMLYGELIKKLVESSKGR